MRLRLGLAINGLLAFGLSQAASAAIVTIDPGPYKGDYNVGTGWIRGGAVQTFTFDYGTTPNISVGGSYPNEIRFHIDAAGNLSSDSTRIAIVGGTIHFQTVEVDVDSGLYDGRYNILGYRSGPTTLHFVPAGTGTDDLGSHYTLGNGASPFSTGFDLDMVGNVITDSTRIIAVGNTITFVTVPVVIDPGNYTGNYNIGRYRSGPQTVHLMPEGTGTADSGSRWALGNGGWPFAIYFDVDVVGNVISDSSRIDVSGNTMTLQTVPIDIDPGAYTGSYLVDGVALSGPQQRWLMQAGTGTLDLGARWALQIAGVGAAPFDLDNPCAIIPQENITVGSGAQGVERDNMIAARKLLPSRLSGGGRKGRRGLAARRSRRLARP